MKTGLIPKIEMHFQQITFCAYIFIDGIDENSELEENLCGSTEYRETLSNTHNENNSFLNKVACCCCTGYHI